MLVFEYVSIGELNISALTRIGIFDPKLPPTRISVRLAFVSSTFDYENCPSFYSEELDVFVDNSKSTVGEFTWMS